MRYEIYTDVFNGTYEPPIRLVAHSDAEAIRLATRLPVANAVLEIWQNEHLVARLQPEQMALPSAMAA